MGGFVLIKVLYSYFICVNVLLFAMMLLDKWYAVKGKWRIPENVLLGIALIGGGVGLVVGMVTAKHKLSKWHFRLVGPFSILLMLIFMGYLVYFETAWLLP